MPSWDKMDPEEGHGGGHETAGIMRWLLTYADLITLLMAFFIVMYAISKVDIVRYQQLVRALAQIFTGGSAMILPELGGGSSVVPPEEPGDPLASLAAGVSEYIAEQGLKNEVFITITEQGVIISFTGSVLFDKGEAKLRPEALPILNKIAALLKTVPNYVGVVGSTDDLPINTLQFPSNWELSVIRATTVIRYLTENAGLEPTRFVALGYGEYHPLFPNTNEENRKKNRRVDIIIYKHNPFVTGNSNRNPAGKSPSP
ncbi:chemotaxis protein MotB [Thermanaeromonas toyohensis ToBE]|uniref:Chemotaxis protein MotB n=1 Tax=Thermanaeromonas toyohensis ToBE TaxID=698762 RepID=A0A1W1VDV9_9FIRM|nr:flagellar motor protein MotB [Thermanaeromonas toyohensis]SMB91562.1 chemotaxis protein MotB [Thermanaeromonas toyohensis ToBE]